MARSELQSLGQLAAQVVATGDPSGPGPVATLGQGDGPQAQSPRRGRKGNALQDGKPVQLALFNGLGPVMPSKLSAHPLYSVWANMKGRCGNPNVPNFKDYGGRGIVVCEEWRASSRAFIAWALANGWQPGLQLDRRDNDGPYSPGNCWFVTRLQNANNKRNSLRLHDGSTVPDTARRLGVKLHTLHQRIVRGMTPDEAVARPVHPVGWHKRQRFAPDGGPLVDLARMHGIAPATLYARLDRGWSLDRALTMPPRPQRRQNGAGRAQPASDVGQGRKGRKAAPAPAPGRCGETNQLQRGAK